MHSFKIPGTHFCQRLGDPRALVWLEGLAVKYIAERIMNKS
jgi:hypothetical protein